MLLQKSQIIEKYSKLNESFHFNDSNIVHSEGKKYDLFLSYNHKDKSLAKAVYQALRNQKISVYVDFIDPSFKPIVDKTTAKILCNRMANCKALAYIHTDNAKDSKWCPWEIGLASGLKNFKCVIIPAVNDDDTEFERQEYLLLYPFTSYRTDSDGHGPFFWVRNSMNGDSKNLKEWINE